MKMKKIALLFGLFFINQNLTAQSAESRVITTGVPFLLVAADARAAGMADQGVATSPDTFSQQWNPAKFAFATDKQGISTSYTPYLTELVNDISLAQVTYYNRINDRSAFAGSFRFFGLGEIELRQQAEDPAQIVNPNEMALDGSYSLKLSERFAMSVAGRYIRSALRIPGDNGSSDAKPASTFAFDLAGFYQSEEIAYSDFNGRWRLGFNLQNLGPKINYDSSTAEDDSANFLPSNMRIGSGFDFIFDEYNKVSVNLELTKLLVPTPQSADLNGDGQISPGEETDLRDKNNAEYNRVTWVNGIIKSFGDAPGGFSEELKEFTYSLGAEYSYQDSFSLRTGYFHESPIKGARKFFSLGAGFKYNIIKVDVSYLFSASRVRNPLENTLRFSLSFNFGDKYEDY
jgi:long-subunit fatty acid transport protein